MQNALNNFRFAQFQFLLKAEGRIQLPLYKGSTFRGAFGHAFKRVICVHPVRKSREALNPAETILKSDPAAGQRGIISNRVNRERVCGSCLLKGKCVYSYVFETPPPSDTTKMRKYPFAPHPFVITPPLEEKRDYGKGESLSFELTLIGKSIDYLPYFIYTFDEMGRIGIGKDKGKYQLEEVRAITGERSKVKGERGGKEGERSKVKGESVEDEGESERSKVKGERGENSEKEGERTKVKGERTGKESESTKVNAEETLVIYSGKDKTLRNDFKILRIDDLCRFNPLPLTYHLPPSSDLSPSTYHLRPSSELTPFTLHPLSSPFDLSPSSLHLSFLTPTRLKFDGKLSPTLEFHILFRNLLRRISLLSYFHCSHELSLDFKGLIEKSKEVRVKNGNLSWYDWERYSNRQETKMMMGGFIGSITFEGDFEPFVPFLLLGEYIHVGKGTSFGLGKYEILPPRPLETVS